MLRAPLHCHRVGGGKRPTRGSVLLGNKGLPRHTFWAETGIGLPFSHRRAVSKYVHWLSLDLSFPICLSHTHHPSPRLDKRGGLARHLGCRSHSNSKEGVVGFACNHTLTLYSTNPAQTQNNNPMNICMYISIYHTGDRMCDQIGRDKLVNLAVGIG